VTYQIDFSRLAEKQFEALPTQVQQRLQPRIDALAEAPRPPGVLKMEGEENLYRIRVGNYRIIYEIQDRVLLIVVVKVGHRSNVYR
jgi:mRNA interferase RelE/StbE